MTTDVHPKEIAISFQIQGKTCKMGAMCKGGGMISPNMATMLLFITTDVAISPALLQKALSADVKDSVNMLSIDRDTSTNDTMCIMASGLAENPPITEANQDFRIFCEALHSVTISLCRTVAKEGAGATKLIECRVSGANSKKSARMLSKAVVSSSLVKTMMFGCDPNVGRILCALGYAGVQFDPKRVDIVFRSAAGEITVCQDGVVLSFDELRAKEILSQAEVYLDVELHGGRATATAFGCDLSYDYIKINGDYRSK
jgi:glutamate N-acetyltransferase/amino-acid N-acetyltransferase